MKEIIMNAYDFVLKFAIGLLVFMVTIRIIAELGAI